MQEYIHFVLKRFKSTSASSCLNATVLNRDCDYKLRERGGNFVDWVRIAVKAGNGGRGSASFNRDMFNQRGKPNGGNGGRGGDVIFVADHNESSLAHLRATYTAQSGGNGGSKDCMGKNAPSLVIRVPIGSAITDITPQEDGRGSDEVTNEKEDEEANKNYLPSIPFSNSDMLVKTVDLDFDDSKCLAVLGGTGGKGNRTTNQNNHETIAPRLGQYRLLDIHLKTLADAGLVGLPNAGKSSFLNAISNARSKISPVPFTTLNPYIGTLCYRDGQQLSLADLPGLIQGASQNIGLGHSFLKHIEKSRILVYVIDMSGKDPWNDYCILVNELENYQNGLSKYKPSIIIANKMDLQPVFETNLETFKAKLQKDNCNSKSNGAVSIISVSAKHKIGIDEAMLEIRKVVESLNKKDPC